MRVSLVFSSRSCMQLPGVLRRLLLPLTVRRRQLLAVASVGIGVGLVAVGLTRLREQDQRGRVGRLGTEGQVQEDEGIEVEVRPSDRVRGDPERDQHGLRDQERRGAEEARERLRPQAEPIAPERRVQVRVRRVKTKVVLACRVSRRASRRP